MLVHLPLVVLALVAILLLVLVPVRAADLVSERHQLLPLVNHHLHLVQDPHQRQLRAQQPDLTLVQQIQQQVQPVNHRLHSMQHQPHPLHQQADLALEQQLHLQHPQLLHLV